MGYAGSQLDTNFGATLVSAQFLGIGSGDSIALDNLVPTDENAAWAIQASFLTPDGGTDSEHDYMWDGVQWVNVSDFQPATGVTIPAGQGLWVNSGLGAACQLRSSGEVSSKDILFPLDTGFGAVAVGNAFPVAVSLDSIVPQPADSLAWVVQASFLTPDGGTDSEHDYMWDGVQWVNVSDFQPATGVMIPAGQGLWVNSGFGAAASLLIPAPEL